MDKPAIATVLGGLTVSGRLTTDHAASSYGLPVFVDETGRAYDAAEIINLAIIEDGGGNDQPSKAELVYQATRPLVPSESWPHIATLAEAGLLDELTVEQGAVIVKLMQSAYRAGQTAQGAEKVDEDYVWLDGVGGLERQPDGAWHLVDPTGTAVQAAATELGRRGGASTSAAKGAASRANGRKGGRPRKS